MPHDYPDGWSPLPTAFPTLCTSPHSPLGAPALGNKLRGFFRFFISSMVLLLPPDTRAEMDQLNATHVLALCGLLPSPGCLSIVQVPFCSTQSRFMPLKLDSRTAWRSNSERCMVCMKGLTKIQFALIRLGNSSAWLAVPKLTTSYCSSRRRQCTFAVVPGH